MRRYLLALSLALCLPATGHTQVLVTSEGVAPVIQGDVHAAREAALRNALADISRSAGVEVYSHSATHNHTLSVDQTQLRTHARILRHEILHEAHEGELYRVQVRAEVADNGGERAPRSSCDNPHAKRLLIGGFPLARPQQLKPNELKGYAHLTAREIVRKLDDQAALLADHQGSLMVRYAAPEHSQADIVLDQQSWQTVRQAASAARAQFVLVGQFRDFALNARENERRLQLDVLLLDAFAGSTVARTVLEESARGAVVVSPDKGFATPAFYATDLGAAYGRLTERAAAWAAKNIQCQPFGTRVIKTEGPRIYIDAGAEQGLQAGDEFEALRADSVQVTTAAGESLGYERFRLGKARLVAVYPRFAVAEMIGHTAPPQPGDELYSY